jgi:hypothetical protein
MQVRDRIGLSQGTFVDAADMRKSTALILHSWQVRESFGKVWSNWQSFSESCHSINRAVIDELATNRPEPKGRQGLGD